MDSARSYLKIRPGSGRIVVGSHDVADKDFHQSVLEELDDELLSEFHTHKSGLKCLYTGGSKKRVHELYSPRSTTTDNGTKSFAPRPFTTPVKSISTPLSGSMNSSHRQDLPFPLYEPERLGILMGLASEEPGKWRGMEALAICCTSSPRQSAFLNGPVSYVDSPFKVIHPDIDVLLVLSKSGCNKSSRAEILTKMFGFTSLSMGAIFRKALAKFRACGYRGDTSLFLNKSDPTTTIPDELIKQTLMRSGVIADATVLLGAKVDAFTSYGQLVPDLIAIEQFSAAFEPLQGSRVVLEGFPRTTRQAEHLLSVLKNGGRSIGAAVVVTDVDDKRIIDRTVERRVCSNVGCGRTYNLLHQPPRAPGACDACGSRLTQRLDDTEDLIINRLREFDTKTFPALEYLKSRGIAVVEVPAILPANTPKIIEESLTTALKTVSIWKGPIPSSSPTRSGL